LDFERLRIGDKAEMSETYSTEKVQLFAKLSNDINPLHLSEEFAKQSFFKKPIVRGFLYSSLISALIANDLPGAGSVYKSQTLSFLLPVYHGEKVTAVVEIVKLIPDKKIVYLSTTIFKESNPSAIVVNGEACIKKL
jgi:3-hydroxybutyryl-CoA dehydratase